MEDELEEALGEPEYELKVPFICCVLQGGKLDDVSFVEGFKLGEMVASTRTRPRELDQWVPEFMVPQYDLVAMAEGYQMKMYPCDADHEADGEDGCGNVFVIFRLGGWLDDPE